jgi:hypothetical protein
MEKHYIAMNGQYGCIPDSCECFDTLEDAVSYLADLYEIAENEQIKKLTNERFLQIYTADKGLMSNEYCEIQECDCDMPWQHSDKNEHDWRLSRE